jgi:FixJ family two-component response regulator
VSRILIADDQPDVLEALRLLLKSAGHQTDAVTSLAGIFNALEKKDYALLMMDLNYTRDTTSGQEGLEVIPKLQEIDNTLPIVVMTAWATIDLAVEAMKRGARDFVPKPWDNERLLSIVRTQIELAGALRKGRRLEAANQLLRGGAPEFNRRIARDASGVGNDFTSGAIGREHFDHGRKWDRQRIDCAGAARSVAAHVAYHDHGEHGWTIGNDFRKRTIWPRQRRLYRRENGSCRPIRAGR